jgi:cephalosporin-C deacetylase-like acetyl esterase
MAHRADGVGPHPTVVMAHGFSAVKEQTLEDLAAVFADAGLASLAYDHRKLRDFRTAITYAGGRTDVDADRIGIFGSSYSAPHVLAVAGADQRVKAAVSQVPLISGFANVQRLNTADGFAGLLDTLDAERVARFEGADDAVLPVSVTTPRHHARSPGCTRTGTSTTTPTRAPRRTGATRSPCARSTSRCRTT